MEYTVPANLMQAIVTIVQKVPTEVGADVYVAIRQLVQEQEKLAQEVAEAADDEKKK